MAWRSGFWILGKHSQVLPQKDLSLSAPCNYYQLQVLQDCALYLERSLRDGLTNCL